ncbi:MAG: hypothetical protein ACPKQO_02980 [Nitrososphaeraceae archaeon]
MFKTSFLSVDTKHSVICIMITVDYGEHHPPGFLAGLNGKRLMPGVEQ